MKFLPVLAFVFFLGIHRSAIAQIESLPVNEWAKKLSDPNDKGNKCYHSLYHLLDKLDSSTVFHFLDQISNHTEKKGNFFLARYNCIRATETYDKSLASPETVFSHNERIEKEVTRLLAQGMQMAYESEDDFLIAFVSGLYGRYMSIFGKTEPAVMYMMNSADLLEKLNLSAEYKTYVVLGEMLWRVREYEKCIHYTHKAIDLLQTLDNKEKDINTMFCSNTIALAFHRIGQYDSAFDFYRQALNAAEKINSLTWKGIISGNMAQIYFISRAMPPRCPYSKWIILSAKDKGITTMPLIPCNGQPELICHWVKWISH